MAYAGPTWSSPDAKAENSASTTVHDVTTNEAWKPNAGDVILAFVSGDAEGVDWTPPTGFTPLMLDTALDASGTGCTQRVFKKIATVADESQTTYTFTCDTSCDGAVVLVGIVPGTGFTDISVSTLEETTVTSASTTLAVPDTDSDAGDVMVLASIVWDSNEWTATYPTGFTGMQTALGNSHCHQVSRKEVDDHAGGSISNGDGSINTSATQVLKTFVVKNYSGPHVVSIGASYYGTPQASSHDIPYPADIESGDTLVCVMSSDDYDATFTIPSPWSLRAAFNAGAGHGVSLEVMAKIADGTETGNLTITTSLDLVKAKMYCLRAGAGAETAVQGATNDYAIPTTTPDPPARAPSTTPDDVAAFVFLAWDAATTSITDWPDGFDFHRYEDDDSTWGAFAGVKEVTQTSSVDPTTFTLASDTGLVYTVVVPKSDLIVEEKIRPVSDVVSARWDSAPTGGQDLFAQVDEATASDTDYIEVDLT